MRRTIGLVVLVLALAASPARGGVRARLEAFGADGVLGWAFDPAAPAARVPVRVRLLAGGREIDARECTADLSNAGREQLFPGTGGHWFRVVFDARRWGDREVWVELSTRVRDGGAWAVRQVARLAAPVAPAGSIGRLRLDAAPGSSTVRVYVEIVPGFAPGAEYWIEVGGQGDPAATTRVATPDDGFDHPAVLEATLPAPSARMTSVAVWCRTRSNPERRLVGAALAGVVELR